MGQPLIKQNKPFNKYKLAGRGPGVHSNLENTQTPTGNYTHTLSKGPVVYLPAKPTKN